ncbi:MAG: GAF domain-containing protein, partial [Bacteroidales bacterium]|nr:GAF domain-containing protein [Bacteroidales bacterium]
MSEIQQANQKKILDTIINLQSLYISDLDDQKLFDEMLLEVLRLTKSQYGFIDSLEKDDKGKTYLQALAITNIAWDKQSRDFFDTMAPLGMRFYDFNALFGPAAQKGEIVISNDVPNDPRK